jgi:PAS domain S-box-containing protein
MASKGHPEASMMELDLEKYPEIRQALQTRRPVVIDDIKNNPLVASVRDVLVEKGYRSLLVLPLLFGKEVLGALFLKSREELFLPEDLRYCKVAASVSANALKNATLYRDVTREAARHQETGEKLRRIVDGTPDMIVATDAEGRVTEFNRGAETMTGCSGDRALGARLSDIMGGGEIDLTGDQRGPLDVTFRRVDGEDVEVSLVSAPLSGPDGTHAGRVWIGRDVTQLRHVERSLAQAERLSSLGEVVAGVAHELNNPLSGVVGYAELLRAGAADPAQIRDLQRIVESAMRCQKIVFKLLSFARKHPPEKRYQSLNDCVTKVLDLKAYHLRSSQIRTDVQLDPELPETCFDFHQLDQVVLNLLNNAEQAITSIKRSGRIMLRTGVEGDCVWVEVEDDGPGVPEQARDRVFDPFFTTKELGKGTGLGLSVSYGIVQEHGGRIELVQGREGEGACFRVYLPIVEGEQAPDEPSESEDGAEATPLRGKRILVAEDDPLVLELFSRLLTQEGAQAVLAPDGERAWRILGQEEFDLIVVDLRMPNISGRELYEKVAEERPELLRRFVFATGDLARHETLAFLEKLPNRILTKPLEQETVRRVLSQALEAA